MTTDELVVTTAQGAIRGERRHGACAWKGIPFAEPPVGPLRFRAPQPPRPWQGERDGTRYGAVATQSRDPRVAMLSGLTDKMETSEDCLYLNVFSPAADGARRPVVVWIHGGAFIMGAGSLPLYHGAGFAARHDVVVVTVNYRLGLFGFLYLGELAGEAYAAGNQALLDQVAALRWVQDNIAAFGGDPGAVTVMGESAGAASVASLLGMPSARGLFARAILQSGASALVLPAAADATELAREVVRELGVTPEGLREVPAATLMALQEQLVLRRGLAAFAPFLDGVALPRRPVEAVRAGEAAVPLLLGSNRDEWALFDVLLGERVTTQLADVVRGRLGPIAELFHGAYLAARGDGAAHGAWVDLLGDLVFRIPMIHLAEAQLAHAPAYVYRFDWAAASFGGKLGAAHALELPFVWNKLDHPMSQLLLGGEAGEAQALATVVHDTWAAFVRTGDPNGAGLPAWPRYDAERRPTMLLGRDCKVADDPGGPLRALWPRDLPRT